jgi:hypothetical protein
MSSNVNIREDQPSIQISSCNGMSVWGGKMLTLSMTSPIRASLSLAASLSAAACMVGYRDGCEGVKECSMPAVLCAVDWCGCRCGEEVDWI